MMIDVFDFIIMPTSTGLHGLQLKIICIYLKMSFCAVHPLTEYH